MAELEAMQPRFRQWLQGEEVPEKHWMYRLAKKYWFNDFGVYRALHAEGKARALKTVLDPKPVIANNAADDQLAVNK